MLGEVKEKEDECRQILFNNNYQMFSVFAHNEIYMLNQKPTVSEPSL